jgi:hypothetical protein
MPSKRAFQLQLGIYIFVIAEDIQLARRIRGERS